MTAAETESDMADTLAALREVTDWLSVPLQIVARYGAGSQEIVDEIAKRIELKREVQQEADMPPAFKDSTAHAAVLQQQVSTVIRDDRFESSVKQGDRVRVDAWLAGAIAATALIFMIAFSRTSIQQSITLQKLLVLDKINRAVLKPLKARAMDVGLVGPPAPRWPKGVVDGIDVRFRAKPGGELLNVLQEGTNLEIIGRSNEWTQVRLTNGEVGWIASRYIAHVQ